MHEKPQVLKKYKDFSIKLSTILNNFLVKFSAGDVRLQYIIPRNSYRNPIFGAGGAIIQKKKQGKKEKRKEREKEKKKREKREKRRLSAIFLK